MRRRRAPWRGVALDSEREVQRADGTVLRVRWRAEPADPALPRVGGTIWLVQDLGAQRDADTALAQARQQAEAARRAKGTFLATMSHEIRTPLNGVLGLARLLQDERDERRRGEYLQHLVEAAESLAGIVSDVLDLSKIESGRAALDQVAFDLPELVTGTFDRFAALGRERGLAMHCKVELEVPPRVRGDPLRVCQILANYLSNALKFTERGRIDLRCSVRADGAIRLAVADTGIGVGEDARERLFLPFSLADDSTTRRYGGTGMGLSICRELAVLMQGRVGADSVLGRGSTFWVELPLAAAPAAAEAEPPSVGSVGGAHRAGGRGQPGQHADRAHAARTPGRARDRGRGWRAGRRCGGVRHAAHRRGTDGPAHAGSGWSGSHARLARPAGHRTAAGVCALGRGAGTGACRRSRCGDGRFPGQAGGRGRPAARAAATGRSAARCRAGVAGRGFRRRALEKKG